MQINLKAHRVNRKQAAQIALLDAIIWLWLHQINYDSLFTVSFIDSVATPAIPGPLIGITLVIGIGRARWDRIPKAIRIGGALAATFTTLGLALEPHMPISSVTLHATLILSLTVACTFAALLRLETLAKCDDFSTLSVALSGSLLLFYLLNLGLLLVPRAVYDACIIAAPLVMLAGANSPAPSSTRLGPLPKKVRLSSPIVVPCLVGLATGLVVALGTVSMATSPSELFTRPAPLFLISQLLFLLLGIITAFGLDLRKATYFALINLCWGLGTTIGLIGREHFIPLPDHILVDMSSFVCLLTLVGFFAFSGI